MKLHCLGTAGYRPNQERHTSCYAIPESGLVLDAGSGLFRLSDLIETQRLDILLSHAHLDHVVGLTFLLDVLHQAEARRGQPLNQLRIFGESAKLAAVQQHLFSEFLFPVQLKAEWIEIDSKPQFSAGGAKVTWRRQPHPGGSVAYRLDWPDRSLVYATDTTGFTDPGDLQWMKQGNSAADAGPPTSAPIPSGVGPGVLIHECNFRDEKKQWALETGHCWTSRLAEIASVVQPRHLLVTHLNPLESGADPVDSDRISSRFPGELSIAQDGLTMEIETTN